MTASPDRSKSQRGAAILEGALASLVFLLVLLGIFEVSRIRMTIITLAFAVQEGGRYAMVNGRDSRTPATAASIQALVRNRAVGLIPNDLSVSTSWTPDNKPGSIVAITASYPFTFVLPFFHLERPFQSRAALTVVR